MKNLLVERMDQAAPWVPAWRRLAEDLGRPYCTPEWIGAWWSHCAPVDMTLQLHLFIENDVLVGVAPLGVVRSGGLRWVKPLASPLSTPVTPMAIAGREKDVSGALIEALERSGGGVMAIEGSRPHQSPLPTREALLESGGWVHREYTRPAPVALPQGRSFDEWEKDKSSNFRQQMRRAERRLEEAGARLETATTPDQIDERLPSFFVLHRRRWEARGGSDALVPGLEAMLSEAGRNMVSDGRFRLVSVIAGDRIVGSAIFVAAGNEVCFWNSGFDDAWAKLKPSLLTIRHAIREACERKEDRVDLGYGDQGYKLRFADDTEDAAWSLAVFGPGLQRTKFLLAPRRLRRWASEKIDPGFKRTIKVRAKALLGTKR